MNLRAVLNVAYSIMVDVDYGGSRALADQAIARHAASLAAQSSPVDDSEQQQAALNAHLAKLGVRA